MVRRDWTNNELTVAFALYCQVPFGKIHHRNPLIVAVADRINRTPSALSMKMANLASLDPAIIKSGRSGLGNASAKDQEVWDLFHNNWESAFEKADYILNRITIESEENSYFSEDGIVQTKTRRKQTIFRNSILSSYKHTCCISGLSYPKLLVASHIKPWSLDKENRLNPRNGLCLSVLYDKAFDLGLLTITPSFRINISPELISNASDSYSKKSFHSLHGKRITLPEKFVPESSFLEYHNQHIFKP